MATDATKFAAILSAAQVNLTQSEEFDLADVLAPDATVTISTDRKGHVVGPEVVVNGILSVTASTALVSGQAVPCGTLIAACRPANDTYVNGRILTTGGALASTGTFKVKASDGVVTFTPDTALAAAAGNKIQILQVRFLLSDADSLDVAAQ
jgi:hypothetical protein